MNREAWLTEAVKALRPILAAAGTEIPDQVHVSVGFPKGNVRKIIGQCWHVEAVADGNPAVFISPVLHETTRVLDVLLHELIHAAGHHGHKGKFQRAAKACGLVAPWTATTASDELLGRLHGIAADLGPYPHEQITLDANLVTKQGTRMLKVECPGCGYVVRTTQKWLDLGTPTCVCGELMEQQF